MVIKVTSRHRSEAYRLHIPRTARTRSLLQVKPSPHIQHNRLQCVHVHSASTSAHKLHKITKQLVIDMKTKAYLTQEHVEHGMTLDRVGQVGVDLLVTRRT